MDFRLRDFVEWTLHKLRPRWISEAYSRPNKHRKDTCDSPNRSDVAMRTGILKGAASVEPVQSDIPADGPDDSFFNLDFSDATPARNPPPVPERIFEGSCEQEADLESLHGAATYTDGPSRIVLANDGTKECLALLLSHDMIGKLNQIRMLDHKVDSLKCQFDDADDDAVVAQLHLNQAEASIAASHNTEDQDRIRKGREEAYERLQKASEKRERIKDHLDIQKNNRVFSRNQWQTMFERVLIQAGLLDVITEEGSVRRNSETSIAQSVEQRSEADTDVSNDSVVSLDQLNRMTTYEEVQETEEWLHEVQDAFDARREIYDNELREYRQAVEDGTCFISQSDFDRIDLLNLRHQTTLLINAEAAHEQAKAQARALGVIGNDLYQESDFVDQEEDGGYLESQDAGLRANVDREFIEAWCTETEDDEDQETLLGRYSDDWDAKTVEISDSISLVDRGRNRRRIDRWREMCGL